MHYLSKITPNVKRILYSSLLLLIILLAIKNEVFAQNCKNCSVSTSFTGVYNDETCEVAINDKGSRDTIELPIISTQSLKLVGSEAGSRNFIISLKNCPTSRNVKLKFIGNTSQTDEETGNLTNKNGIEYSKNTQIRIRKEDGGQIKVNDLSSAQDYVIPESGDTVMHEYNASYYAKAAATSGVVSATAGIEVFYK